MKFPIANGGEFTHRDKKSQKATEQRKFAGNCEKISFSRSVNPIFIISHYCHGYFCISTVSNKNIFYCFHIAILFYRILQIIFSL